MSSTHNVNEAKMAGIIGSAATVNATKPAGNNKRKRQKKSASTTITSTSSGNGMRNEMENGSVTRQLLQCLPRALLENLICRSIQTSAALSIHDIQTALPSDLQWKARAITTSTSRNSSATKNRQVVVTTKGPSRVGTGFFDAVDDENMRLVLLFLPLQERIPCVTRVCKAWREFKHLPGLWDDLTQWDKHPREDRGTLHKYNAMSVRSFVCCSLSVCPRDVM